jgi:WD40 repeat protein
MPHCGPRSSTASVLAVLLVTVTILHRGCSVLASPEATAVQAEIIFDEERHVLISTVPVIAPNLPANASVDVATLSAEIAAARSSLAMMTAALCALCAPGATCLAASAPATPVSPPALCACPPGRTGSTCDTVLACSSSPCRNGGSCEDSAGSFLCQCPPVFSGLLCDVSACRNGGTLWSNRCLCPLGFAGSVCEIEVSTSAPCALAGLCQNDGSCDAFSGAGTPWAPTYRCVCQMGFVGHHCERLVDALPTAPLWRTLGGIDSMVLSAGGDALAVTKTGMVWLFNMSTALTDGVPRIIRTLDTSTVGGRFGLSASSDMSTIIAAQGNNERTIAVLDGATGSARCSMSMRSATFAPPHMQLMAVVTSSQFSLYNTTACVLLRPLTSALPVLFAEWSPDGSWLAGNAGSGDVYLWRAADWSAPPLTLPASNGPVFYCLRGSPDGRFLAVCSGASGTIDIWNVTAGVRMYALSTNLLPVPASFADRIAWSRDSTRLFASFSGAMNRVVMWRLNATTLLRVVHLNFTDSINTDESGYGIGWRVADDACIHLSLTARMRVYSTHGDRLALQQMVDLQPACVDSSSLQWTSGGSERLTCTSRSSTVLVFDAARGAIVHQRPANSTSRVLSNPRLGSNMVVMAAAQPYVLDWLSGDIRTRWSGASVHSSQTSCLSVDGSRALTMSLTNQLQVWWAGNGSLAFAATFGTSIRVCQWNPHAIKRSLVAVSRLSAMQLWSAELQRAVLVNADDTTSDVLGMAWAPDGDHLAVMRSQRIQMLNVTANATVSWIAFSNGQHIAWSPNGVYLAVGSSAGVTVFDVRNRSTPGPGQSLEPSNQYSVHHLAWSEDGTRLAVGVVDGQVRMYVL